MQNLCPWEVPSYFIFSSDVPTLFYYSYLPIIFVCLFIGTFVLVKDKYSLLSKIFFSASILFAVWVGLVIVQWTAVDPAINKFAYQIIGAVELPIFLLLFYFIRVFTRGKDIGFSEKLLLVFITLPAFISAPTLLTVRSFSLDCTAELGYLWDYIYILELIVIALCAIQCFMTKQARINRSKKELWLLGLGSVVFLSLFFVAGFVGDVTQVFEFNVIGPVGMTAFIVTLSYLMVKFRIFQNVKVFATQALVVALWILTFGILFIRRVENVRMVVIATLVLFTILGISLIRSVKREIEAKEKVEKLAGELEQANIQQESLIRFISHEMKGYLTTSAGVFASIVEGDFNPISEPLKSSAEMALTKVREGVRSVVEILSNANAKKGTLAYKMESFDFGKVVLQSIEKLSHDAQEKGLVLETTIKDDGTYRVMGDTAQLSEHVVRNLIDNSIKYTPTGSIHIDLSKQGSKVLLSIRDTGVGITAEDKTRLFTEGGRGKDSIKVNVHSTGYGLAIAKKIVDAHSGRIWAESEGAGKGSQFYVELPEAK